MGTATNPQNTRPSLLCSTSHAIYPAPPCPHVSTGCCRGPVPVPPPGPGSQSGRAPSSREPGHSCVPLHICQRWISFQRHWAKKWQLHDLSRGMLSAFILKFKILVPGCALFFVFLFVSLFAVSLLLLGQIRRKGTGRVVCEAQLFHPLRLSSAVPPRTTVVLTCNKRQRQCNGVPWEKHGESMDMSLGKQGVASCIFRYQLSLPCPGFYHFVGLSMICEGERWVWALCPTALHHSCCCPREVTAQNAELLNPSMVLSPATSAIFHICKDQLKAALLVETSGKEQE